MNSQPTPPPALLHTPEELLHTARELLASGNHKLYRGAILEALASLESFIHSTVFPSLKQRFSAEFSTWLEEKTRMDFDSRLSVLAPIVTGIPVAKSSALWSKYKQTREIRKCVVHGSRKVTKAEAQQVIDTTAEWLAYLGSTIELETALLELKHWVESQAISPIQSEADAERIIAEFFARNKGATSRINPAFKMDERQYEADVILEFGARKVLIETKFIRGKTALRKRIDEAVAQISRLRQIAGITQACVVIFAPWPAQDVPTAVEKYSNGEIVSVVVGI